MRPAPVILLLILVIFLAEYAEHAVGFSTNTNSGPESRLSYTRDVLINLRPSATRVRYNDTTLLPQECVKDNTIKARKRGRKGGLRERIKRQPYRQPLPSIMLGNVQSIRNKADELRACTQYLSDYRQSCLICLTETWLTETDPDSSVDLEGYTLVRMDRNLNSGKSKGGGVCAFINNKYCYPSHITTKHQVCTKDIELLELSLRPYYLPREIHQIRLFVVYIAPSADTQAAAALIHELVSQAEAEAPDAAKIIMGDFNLCSLNEHLPTYQQYVTCPTRNEACLDLCYGNIKDAFYAKALSGLGSSDHNMVKLVPAYEPRLRREKAKRVEVKSWTTAATEALQDCLECTDWDVVNDGYDSIDDAVFAISGYIKFCKDTIIPKRSIKVFPNNKPWVTPALKQLLNQKKWLFKSGGSREEKKIVQK